MILNKRTSDDYILRRRNFKIDQFVYLLNKKADKVFCRQDRNLTYITHLLDENFRLKSKYVSDDVKLTASCKI